jgi:hypothetical protein
LSPSFNAASLVSRSCQIADIQQPVVADYI